MAASLIIRPSGLPEVPWALQLRWHDSVGETEYHTLWRGSEEVAREIIEAGEASWLFGDPRDRRAALQAQGEKTPDA